MKLGIKQFLVLLLSAAFAFAVAGCEKKGPAQKAGESIDNAAESAGDSLESAGQELQNSLE